MRTSLALVLSFTSLAFPIVAQTPAPAGATPPAIVVGDRTSPLRPVAGDGNIGISNAVMRDQGDVRVLRVMVEPGGVRAMHAHADVKFHMFVPVSGPMRLTVEGSDAVVVPPWQPFYMKTGTRHTFQNPGSTPVEIMEVFVK